MPSGVNTPVIAELNPHTNTDSKRGFKTVLGLSPFTTPTPVSTSQPRSAPPSNFSTVKERRSLDVSGSSSYFVSLSYRKKKSRVDRTSIAETSFFHQALPVDAASIPTHTPTPPLQHLEHTSTSTQPASIINSERASVTMTRTIEVAQERASRRKLVRMDAQEGPWSISVAENPYDKKNHNNYSIYIKSESLLS